MTSKEIRDFMKQTCCPFLAARKGYWIGAGSEKEKSMKGKNFYPDNAYNYLRSQESNVKKGRFLSGEKYDKECRQQIVEWATKAYDRKIKELEDVLDG